MYINTVISVYDEGDTNPVIHTHIITTNDKEANDKFGELIRNAIGEGWKAATTTDMVQANFSKGGPRRTLTIRRDCTSFTFGFSATK